MGTEIGKYGLSFYWTGIRYYVNYELGIVLCVYLSAYNKKFDKWFQFGDVRNIQGQNEAKIKIQPTLAITLIKYLFTYLHLIIEVFNRKIIYLPA